MENHIANVPYSSDPNEDGSMGNVPIQGRQFNALTRHGHEVSLQISHPNQLRSYFIDDARGRTVFQPSNSSLMEFVQTLPPPFVSYNVPNKNQNPVITGVYLREEYKVIIRQLVSYIQFVHENQFCTGNFAIENVVIADERPKFVGIEMVLMTPDRINEDYNCLYRLIENILLAHVLDPDPNPIFPPDLADFMELIGGFQAPGRPVLLPAEKYHLIKNHIAIMDEARRNWFFNQVCETQNWLHGNKYSNYLLAVLRTTIHTGWNMQIDPDSPLQNVFDYPHVNYQPANQNNSRYKHDLIRFFRNSVEHLKGYKHAVVPPLTEKDSSRMLMVTFPTVMSELQHHLANFGILPTV